MKMEDVKKWSVTYTKQVKQKRKVYQDGILEFHSSSHKISLYDDCDKLLYSRLVKLDDVVKSGETITFDAYLIDIGEPVVDFEANPNLDFQEQGKEGVDHGVSFPGKKFKDNSTFVGRRSGINKACSDNLSPSQKIIREFKKTEVKKYCASPSSVPTQNSLKGEWQVLYTTQLTQKAKKFHDGILKLIMCGSQGRQVMLYDETRQLLDSRFLKKDEIIKSGESLKFDGHLVEVGESEGEHKPVIDVNATGRNCSAVGKVAEMNGGKFETHNSDALEWDAMYTTQVTQKAKKYHCGIIRLTCSGSYRMQATLLADDGITLTSRFLNLSEHISSGRTFQLLNYLVEVGEPRKQSEGESKANVFASKPEDLKVDRLDVDTIKLSRRIPAKKERSLCNGETQHGDSALQHADLEVRRSGADEVISYGGVPTKKPLRDAHAILSILRKPNAEDGIVSIERASIKECHAPQDSDSVSLDIQHQSYGQPMQGPSNKSIAVHDCKPIHNDQSAERISSENSGNRADAQQRDPSFGIETSIVSSPNHEVESNNISMEKGAFANTEPQVSEPYVLYEDSCNKLNGNVGIPESLKVMSSEVTTGISTLKFNLLSEEVEQGTIPQPSGGNTLTNSTSNNEVCIAPPSDCISRDNSDVGKQGSEEHIYLSAIDDYPSFDLGF